MKALICMNVEDKDEKCGANLTVKNNTWQIKINMIFLKTSSNLSHVDKKGLTWSLGEVQSTIKPHCAVREACGM